jgi:GGDEF domain-containing protein
MTVVSAGSIYSESWKTVRNLINENRTVLSGCYAAFPDFDDQKTRINYPLCTVETALANNTDKSFGLKNRELTISFEISCFSKKAEQLDEIVNEVDYALTSNQTVTDGSGLKALNLTSNSTDHVVINNEKVHMKTLVATYVWRGDL